LKLIEAKQDTVFKIVVENKRLILEPLSDAEVERMVLESAESVMETHRETLDKLAK
jgi:hypothetical protein